MNGRESVVALCGGVGGAKLAAGLADCLDPALLTVVVNTGDDFEHLGLTVCPDIDTVLYTLAGLNDTGRGWGLAGETWSFMEALATLGGPTWFQLGDRDLATHVARSDALRNGRTLSQVVAALAHSLAVRPAVLPVSDQPVRTMVQTDIGELPFQRYFVEQRCRPRVQGIRFAGAEAARVTSAVRDALQQPPAAVIVCPSNPYLSVDPLLGVPGMRDLLTQCAAPLVAVSPIVKGDAVKGPAAKIMRELGHDVNSLTIAEHYRTVIDGLVIDSSDAALAADIEALGMAVQVTDTLMRNPADRRRLAAETVDFAARVAAAPGRKEAS